MYVWTYTLLILIYMVNKLLPLSIFSYSVGILAAIALIISFRKASGLYFITGLLFLIFGFSLFIYFKEPLYTFIFHFETMLGLLSLFLILPFINSLIHVGHFDSQLNQLLNLKTRQLSQLYRRGSLVTQMLGIFLNIATIPLMVKSLSFSLAPFQENMTKRFYTRNLLRAYALALTWSPLEVLVSIVIDTTNTRYYQIFPVLFLLAMFFLTIDWAISTLGKYRNLPIHTPTLNMGQIKRVKKKILQLSWMLLMLITVVSIVEYLIGYGFLFSIVLVIIPFSLTSALIMKKIKQYLIITIPDWQDRTKNLSNYFFMFLSAGFFVEMVTKTNWMMDFQSFLANYIDQVFTLYLFIGGYFVVTSLIGFHPLVSLSLIISILEPLIGQLAPIPFTLVLVSCSLATVMYSPYNLSVSLLSSEIKVNPYRITQWNIGFALIYMFISIGIAYLIYLI